MLQIQEVAQLVADNGLSTGGMIALILSMGVVILILFDRMFYMLKSWGIIRGKKNNPNSIDVKLADLHEWYVPGKIGEAPPFMLFFKEFENSHNQANKAYEDNTAATHMLISTLKSMQESATMRDDHVKKNTELLHELLVKVSEA